MTSATITGYNVSLFLHITAVMIGFGRAIGETIAVALTSSASS